MVFDTRGVAAAVAAVTGAAPVAAVAGEAASCFLRANTTYLKRFGPVVPVLIPSIRSEYNWPEFTG